MSTGFYELPDIIKGSGNVATCRSAQLYRHLIFLPHGLFA